MKVFQQALILSSTFVLLLAQATVALGDEASKTALKSWGRAYQTNYHAQQNMPPGASQADRDAVTRKSFAVASKLMGAEMDKRQRELAKSELDFANRLKNRAREIAKSHKDAGLDKLSKADKRKKKHEMLLARLGIKGDPKGLGKGGSGSGAGAPGLTRTKAPSEIGGVGGAKGVEYEQKKELKIIDGIIQD